jgi:hypothetical protein
MLSEDLPYDPRRTPDPALRVPDLADAVEGWRAWQVARDLPRYGTPPKLYSATYAGYYWTPRRAAHAECRYGCEKLEIPGESCTCGFYSAKTLEHLMEMGYPSYDADGDGDRVCVIGQIACWGKVIEGTQGWRSSKAYPIKLFVPFEVAHLAKPLQAAYGCKVGLKNFIQPAFERKAV